MADNSTNLGQFDSQQDDQQMNSGGNNLREDRQRASEMGKMGAQAQPRSAKAEGGRNSQKGESDTSI